MSELIPFVLVGLCIGNVTGFAFALVWMAHRGYGKFPTVDRKTYNVTPYSAYQLPTRKMQVRR